MKKLSLKNKPVSERQRYINLLKLSIYNPRFHRNSPDEVFFVEQYTYDCENAFPFIYLKFNNENKLLYGKPGATHFNMRKNLQQYLLSKGYKLSDITGCKSEDEYSNTKYIQDGDYLLQYYQDETFMLSGRYYVVDVPVINQQCVIFAFWGMNKEPKKIIDDIIYKICKEKKLFDRRIFITNGSKPLIAYNDFTPFGDDMDIEDNSEQAILHMMNAKEKHMATTDYRSTRDKNIGKKLTMSNGKEMPLAQYNALRYVDEDKESLLNRLINEGGITELTTLPKKYFECVKKYYDNGELTTNDGKFIENTCHRLNEIFKWFNNNVGEFEDISLRELFKKYGKIVESYKLEKPILRNTLNENFDAVARTHYSISGEKLDKYCHIIDDVVNEMTNDFETNQMLTKESLTELCSSNEVEDVMASFDIQKTLNNKLWDENKHLNSRVRMRLIDIADKFYETLETNWVEPIDVILTGSICNYNWSRYSDIDLHILVDFKEVDERVNFVKDYFDSKKKIWNSEHDNLSIYGFPVELYLQDISEKHSASGMYSLYKDEWIVEPNRDNFDVDSIDRTTIANKVMKCADSIDSLEELANNETDEHKIEIIGAKAKKLFTKIKSIRKNALKNGGEYAAGNIFYKALKRIGYLGKLIELKAKTFDSTHSIK